MRALSDDSDTDDSDYDPTKDTTRGKDDSGDEGENEQQEAEVLKDVSYLRKRKANDLWDQLNASDRTETEEQIRKSKRFGLANTEGDTVKENKKKKKMKSTKVKSVLAGIFGKTQASSLMNNSYSSSTSSGSSSSKNGAKEAISVEMKEAIRQSVKSIQKKQTIEETKKFAGKNVTIQRSVLSNEASATPAAPTPASALDKALAAIKGPENVSTVAKSGADWDNFKEKEGLEDELQVAQKEGFLTRKEFLERVDYRKFEQERDQRLREQAIRGAPG